MHDQIFDDGYWAFAADALLPRLDAVAQESAGVREGKDIEFVHRMRVASRRLRSAIAIFDACLASGNLDGFKKPIRRITRELGAARDLDVQLEALEEFLKGDPDSAHHPGIERLELRIRQQRAKMQLRVVEAIDRLQGSTVWVDFQRPLREIAVRANLRGTRRESRQLRQAAARAIILDLEGLLSHETYVDQPGRVEELHQMRIAAKKLRYGLEIFAPLFPGAMDEAQTAIKEVQKLLGEIHDCDVWTAMLPQFIAQERERTLEYFGHARHFGRIESGIEFLRVAKVSERAAHYAQFTEYWKQTTAQGVWEKLHRVLQHPYSSAHSATAVSPGYTTADQLAPKPERPETPDAVGVQGSASPVEQTAGTVSSELGGT